MLRRYRRYVALLAFGVLATPLIDRVFVRRKRLSYGGFLAISVPGSTWKGSPIARELRLPMARENSQVFPRHDRRFSAQRHRNFGRIHPFQNAADWMHNGVIATIGQFTVATPLPRIFALVAELRS